MQLRTLAALAAAALMPAAAAAEPSNPVKSAEAASAPRSDIVRAYEVAIGAYQAEQVCDRAAPLLDAVIASPDFGTLDRARQAEALAAAGDCAGDHKDWARAYDLLVKATSYAEARDWAFAARIEVADIRSHWEDLVASLELAAEKRPAAVSRLKLRRVYRVARDLEQQKDKTLVTRYRAALDRADYRPDEPFDDASGLWLDFAADRADAGDMASATRALRRIDRFYTLTRAVVDRRFSAIVDADPQHFDVRAVAERQLAADRAASAANPHLIDGPITVARDLRALGRAEEALTLLGAAEPMLHSADTTDLKEHANWYWDERARTLRDLGRRDEAAQELLVGAASGENGAANVSQTLNLGDLYVWAGKPDAALAAVEPIKGEQMVSPYGFAFRAQIRACAYAQLGRKAEMASELAYIRAHESDNWTAATDAPLCAGDLNASAAAFVRELADPEYSREALVELSEFDAPAHPTALEQAFSRRLRAVAARPDVKAAVARAGRTVVFHIQAEYY
jgi:hypothetical protein